MWNQFLGSPTWHAFYMRLGPRSIVSNYKWSVIVWNRQPCADTWDWNCSHWGRGEGLCALGRFGMYVWALFSRQPLWWIRTPVCGNKSGWLLAVSHTMNLVIHTSIYIYIFFYYLYMPHRCVKWWNNYYECGTVIVSKETHVEALDMLSAVQW